MSGDDGKMAVLTSEQCLFVWNTRTAELIAMRKFCFDVVYFCFLKCSEKVVLIGSLGCVQVLSLAGNSVQAVVEASEEVSMCCHGLNFVFAIAPSTIFMVPLDCPAELLRLRYSHRPADLESVSCHFQREELIFVEKNRPISIYAVDRTNLELRPVQKLTNTIGRTFCKYAGFSHQLDFESLHVYSTTNSHGSHATCIWNLSTGAVVRNIGEDVLEAVGLALWHPRRWLLLTVGAQTGHIYMWGPEFAQTWSALVANIDPIDCNAEYIEREDEFDLFDEAEDALEPIEIDAFFGSPASVTPLIIWPIN